MPAFAGQELAGRHELTPQLGLPTGGRDSFHRRIRKQFFNEPMDERAHHRKTPEDAICPVRFDCNKECVGGNLVEGTSG